MFLFQKKYVLNQSFKRLYSKALGWSPFFGNLLKIRTPQRFAVSRKYNNAINCSSKYFYMRTGPPLGLQIFSLHKVWKTVLLISSLQVIFKIRKTPVFEGKNTKILFRILTGLAILVIMHCYSQGFQNCISIYKLSLFEKPITHLIFCTQNQSLYLWVCSS